MFTIWRATRKQSRVFPVLVHPAIFKHNWFFAVFCVLFFLPVVSITSYASYPELTEPTPANLEWTVSDTCVSHSGFRSVSVRLDGSFATITWQPDLRDSAKNTNQYVDIYSPTGEFLRELSFYTEGTVEMQYHALGVTLFFPQKVLLWEENSDTLYVYSSAEWAKVNPGFLPPKAVSEFTVDGWRYTCKGSFFQKYNQLIRTNGSEEQVLLDLRKTDFTQYKEAVAGGAFIILAALIGVCCVHQHNRRMDRAQG